MIKKYRILSALVLFATVAGFAQDSSALIETYRRNFIRSSLGTKLELLKEASGYDDVDMGPLYDSALQFVLANASILSSDALLRDISVLSVNMIRKYKYSPAAENLWKLFSVYKISMSKYTPTKTVTLLSTI